MLRFGHGKAGTDFPAGERQQVAISLRLGAGMDEQLHIAHIGRLAAKRIMAAGRAPQHFAHPSKLGQRQSLAAVRYRKSQPPESGLFH